MNRKMFFLIVGSIVILMVAYFSIHLFASAEKQCYPAISYDCIENMEVLCLPDDHTGFSLFHSWCLYGTCWAEWYYYCDFKSKPDGYIECGDPGGFGCEE